MSQNKIQFPHFVSEKKQKEITEAIESGRTIIITGKQGATGKTTVTNILKDNGILAFEKYECVEIEI